MPSVMQTMFLLLFKMGVLSNRRVIGRTFCMCLKFSCTSFQSLVHLCHMFLNLRCQQQVSIKKSLHDNKLLLSLYLLCEAPEESYLIEIKIVNLNYSLFTYIHSHQMPIKYQYKGLIIIIGRDYSSHVNTINLAFSSESNCLIL